MREPSKGLTPATRTTLAHHVCEQIVDAIAIGAITSGQRLTESELAQELEVSRVPVREAMSSLRSQGILVDAPQRGLQVAQFDQTWADTLYHVRLALETSCAELVAAKLRDRPECADHIEAALDGLRSAVRLGSPGDMNRADIAFHDALYRLAASPLLGAMWEGIARHVLIVFPPQIASVMAPDDMVAEHQAYFEELLAGDSNALRKKVVHHLRLLRNFDVSTDLARRAVSNE